MKKIALMLVPPIVVFAVVLLLQANEMPPQEVESPHTPAKAVTLSGLASPSAAPINTGLEQLPASLQGTQVDGVLRADKEGNLIINHDIRRVFDYFLSTIGDQSLAEIEQRLRDYIRHQLPATAAPQAEQLLEDYLALNRALSELPAPEEADANSSMETSTLRGRLLAIQNLRRQFLPADVVDVFYADDDALDQLALARMDIMQDPTLSTTQQTLALAAIEQSLPLHLQTVMNKLSKQQQMSALTAQLRDNGGSNADIYQLRESFFGPAAADRLAQLDESRQQWQARTTRWLSDRDRLLATLNIDETDRQYQLDQLRSNIFEPAELRRVKMLERLHDQGL